MKPNATSLESLRVEVPLAFCPNHTVGACRESQRDAQSDTQRNRDRGRSSIGREVEKPELGDSETNTAPLVDRFC